MFDLIVAIGYKIHEQLLAENMMGSKILTLPLIIHQQHHIIKVNDNHRILILLN